MTTADQMFRRNFTVATVLHVALIIGVVLYEGFVRPVRSAIPTAVELVTPADILGDLPQGSGTGRGAYAPPVQQPVAPPPQPAPAPPSESVYTPEERPAPQARPTPAPQPTPNPNDILIPKNTNPAPTPQKPTPTPASRPKPSVATSKATARSSGSTRPAPSAADIRNRFANALQASAGGTPYGDGRAPGGGSGKSSVIGSPDGSPDGVVRGIGKGSPYWWYYQHVHDRMYEAWEQPGEALSGGRDVVAVIQIHVLPDGRVTSAILKHTSGNKLMDESALAAARKVTKLNAPPPGVGSDIDVEFQLERKT